MIRYRITEMSIDVDRRYTMSLRLLNILCNDRVMYSCIYGKSKVNIGGQ